MKIALVSPYDFAYPGGVVNHISCLEQQFTRMGHEVKIIAPASKAIYTLGDRFIRIGTPRPIPVSGSIARITLSVRLESQIKEVFEREKFDICHLHEPLMPTLCTTVLRLKKAPMVGTFHASGGKPWYTMFSPDHEMVPRPVVPQAGWPHCRFQRSLRVCQQIFPRRLHDYSQRRRHPPLQQRVTPIERFNDGKTNILFVGRLEKRKGFDYLLEAYRLVKAGIPGLPPHPGGARGTAPQEIRKTYPASTSIEDVIFTGYATYDDLPRYYKTADIVCFPTTGWESQGIVLLEAMAVGKPIVASDIDGFTSVLTDGVEGITVPPRNAEKLAEAI